RPHVASFRVAGTAVERVQPVAFRADDFVDEWAHAPWQQAENWTRASGRTSASRWHPLLSKQPTAASYMTHFDSVQSCAGSTMWQVRLQFYPFKESGRLPNGVPRDLFFLVAREQSRFEIVSVDTRRSASCPGRTPPPPQPTDLPK